MIGFNFIMDKNRIDEILEECEDQRDRALVACGLLAEGFAKKNLTENGSVDTGNLRNSVSFVVDGEDMWVGTPVEYAQYVEFGTGAANVAGGTPKPSWVYMGEDGKFHRAFPQPARAFIKPAITEHQEEYINAIRKYMGGNG